MKIKILIFASLFSVCANASESNPFKPYSIESDEYKNISAKKDSGRGNSSIDLSAIRNSVYIMTVDGIDYFKDIKTNKIIEIEASNAQNK